MTFRTKILVSIAAIAISSPELLAQDRRISAGITVEFSVENPSNTNLYGIQGKYDITSRQGLQTQLGIGNNDLFFAGADYLSNLFQINPMSKLFVGGGLAYEGIRGSKLKDIALSSQDGLELGNGRTSP